MADMKFKENLGLSPVVLGKGYEKLDGPIPNSGENIFKPESAAREAEEAKLRLSMGMNDDPAEDEGFLDRDLPQHWERPNRTDDEDLG